MKKRVYGKKLNRERDTRRALFRSLTASLVKNGKIVTTKEKAKAIQPMVEKLVTLAKKKDQQSYRRVYAKLGNNKEITKILFGEIAPGFEKRNGGYTRIIKVGRRKGDDAMEVKMEWVKADSKAKEEKPKKTKKTKKETKKTDKKSKK